MKQVLQNLKSGNVGVEDVPQPVLRDGGILVRSRASLISAGTERMMLQLGKKSLVGKAKERPDLVKQVLNKVKRDGFWATFHAVRDRLDSDTPLGYSLCGEVLQAGARAAEFTPGELVACAGAGYANHAEINYVPRLLAAKVPTGVTPEQAAYATVGSIALQGIRNADPRVGEVVVVIGLGLVGQLTVQQLRAAGCRVVGLDHAPDRVALAAAHGADLALVATEPSCQDQIRDFSRGRGADSILITAATSSNEPIETAAEIARDRAKIIMVGVTGMDIPRAPYFAKELTFIVSRSYGPGRYDPNYEERGNDYPAGYVRWTENRNIEAFLDMVASGVVRPEVCTTHRFEIADALSAFELILTNSEPHLGVVLTYPESADAPGGESRRIEIRSPSTRKPAGGSIGVSFLGAGNFARAFLLPRVQKDARTSLRGVVTGSGVSAKASGKKFGFDFCASDEDEILGDAETNIVFIATRHSQHAPAVCRALDAGKNVFVEKPLAVSVEQLQAVRRSLDSSTGGLMVGFNRRFAPHAVAIKEFMKKSGPLTVQFRCNAGTIPAEHWLSDRAEGGRIIGEACHFFDLFNYWTGVRPERVFAAAPRGSTGDDAAITVDYADGSVCQLIYTTTGSPVFGKERAEVFAGGKAAVLDDFKQLVLQPTTGRATKRKLSAADKGHSAELSTLFAAIAAGDPMPISAESLFDTTLASFAAMESLRTGQPVAVDASLSPESQ